MDLFSNNLEHEFNMRQLLYDNKDVIQKIEDDSEEEVDEDEETKKITDAITQAQKSLKDNIIEYNKISMEKQKLDDIIKNTKNTCFDIQNRVDHLHNICSTNKIEVDHIQDTLDQINYSLLYITDSIETAMKEKKQSYDDQLITCKKKVKTLSRAYNVLRNTSVSYTCPVCLCNQVDCFNDPCGHSMCTLCASKTNHCYFCRARVSRVVKLFFML